MFSVNVNNILSYNEEIHNEIFNVDAILNAAKCCCESREFSGEYYGVPTDYVQNISNERNQYLSLLNVLSEKVTHINKLCKNIDRELTLH